MPFKTDGTFEPEDASVSKQLTSVLDTKSPLLTRARTGAAQESNRRGLLNSSIAVQAGEAAALDVALPIASQQAGQIHQANLAGGQIASTEGLASRQITSTEGLAKRELGSRAELQAADITAAETRLGRQLTSAETIQLRELSSRESLLASDIASRESLTRETLASQELTTTAEILSKEAISTAGIAAQERIAASNVASFEREKATAAIAQFDNNYQNAFRTISSNEDLPAATREAYLTHLAALRDSNLSLVEQLYNIDLLWATPDIAGAGGDDTLGDEGPAPTPAPVPEPTPINSDPGGTFTGRDDEGDPPGSR